MIDGPAFGDYCGPWHRCFAWKPVKTYNRRTVWLRMVWRRCVARHDHLSGPGDDFWWWYSLENPYEASDV
jgi:hypothetical protein